MEDLKKDAEDNKIMGILAYLGILFLVPYLAAKESPFARFHANQGCVLFVAWIALYIVAVILGVVLVAISWKLATLTSILYMLVSLCFFVFMILGIINAAKGEMKELPIIGKYKFLK